jgi:hypothetical protein
LALEVLVVRQPIQGLEQRGLILVLAHMELLPLAAVMAAIEMEMAALVVPVVGQVLHLGLVLLVHQGKVMRVAKVLIIQFR